MSQYFPRLTLLVFGFSLSTTILAQQPAGAWGRAQSSITGSITGQVVDSITGAPVEFATLVLKRLPAAKAENSTPAPQPDSARQAMFIARLTERLGHTPDSSEIAQARQALIQRSDGQMPEAAKQTVSSSEPQQVDGTITDGQGRFSFKEVALGNYLIEATFIGYEVRRVRDITLTGKRPDLSLDNIRLSSSTELLSEVVVSGEASLIENRVDKIVYNASQDVVNQGGDGSDVLRRVPLLSVDLDGNVSLRGSSQVQILINGRPSTMFAGSVGEALQAMPADQIEKVEVITSPGARYQGEGTAGIINIITKRGGLKGLTGNADASLGTRSNNVSLNMAYTKGRFGINGGFGSRFSWPRPTETSLLRVDTLASGSTRTLSQNAEGSSNWVGLNGNIGAFYDLNAFNSFNTSLRINGRQRSSDLFQNNELSSPSESIFQRYTLDTKNFSPSINYDWTTDYKRKFRGEDHELNLAFQLGASTRNQDYERLGNAIVGNFGDRDEKGDNIATNLEYTLQADYQAPLTDKLFLETGAQGIIRDLKSDYSVFDRSLSSENFMLNQDRTNIFNYNQDVYAGYLSFRNKFSERLSAIAGLRYEHTIIAGEQMRADSIPPFNNNYDNFLPSISLQFKINETASSRLSYSRRIRRPGLGDINPFVNQSDPRNISFGNPTLSPEVTDQLELSGNTRLGPGFINASVFYRETKDLISEFLNVDSSGVTRSTSINLGSTDSYGANLFANYTLFKILKIRGGINLEHLSLIGSGRSAGLQREVWQYDLNGSFTLELPKKIVVEAFGFYRAPQQTIQGERASFRMWSIGAQKKLMEDRWRIGVRIVEPFERRKNFPNSLQGEGFSTESNYAVLFRSFGVSASYRFGQLQGNKARERRSKINNNDQREGGGGEF